MTADADGLFCGLSSALTYLSLAHCFVCAHITINDRKKRASKQTQQKIFLLSMRLDGRQFFFSPLWEFIASPWHCFGNNKERKFLFYIHPDESFCVFANSSHPCALIGFLRKRLNSQTLIHTYTHSRYKRWLNQKRFVFIHIENLTNQHNFASSCSFIPQLEGTFLYAYIFMAYI